VVEKEVEESVRLSLARRGHNVETAEGLGNAHGLVIEYAEDGTPVRFYGAADPRGEGEAKGY